MLLNRTRAWEFMDRNGLDALVAQVSINVYYLSDYWGSLNAPGFFEGSYFAVLPRREDAPAALVLPSSELRRLVSAGGTWMPNVFSYSTPAPGAQLADGTAAGVPYDGWPARPGAALLPLEQRWVEMVAAHRERMSADGIWALVRALRAAGLESARLGTDDERIGSWLAARGCKARCEYRRDVFNSIRLVKTPAEIELMRTAAQINERALLAGAAALRVGAEWGEIEDVFMRALAERGGRGVYLLCGLGGLPAGKVRRDEPIMLDGLGRYRQYHADFGRCAVVGTPSAQHRARHHALTRGWERAHELLRPGTRMSELRGQVIAAIRAAGFAEYRGAVVHNLGLEHTDDPKPVGAQPGEKPDQVLEPGMVVNVDMPYTEIGWGSVHIEDTVVITAGGCDPLTSLDLAMRINA
ncbi:MAG: M24 family metallopeptidase [Steroidobacteraceae bacterium]